MEKSIKNLVSLNIPTPISKRIGVGQSDLSGGGNPKRKKKLQGESLGVFSVLNLTLGSVSW